ncbi:MAG: flagellar biosynthesis anti-sigma factor FlgM [Desulfovibrio sp.]|jgi:negative regulator of flagellin synthesis FlgM|nr:flagellar biosynthesis anti-sigma factor FlgM [Desulfovibrio sp.]
MEIKNSLLKHQLPDPYLARTASANETARSREEKPDAQAVGVSAEGDRVSLSQSARLHTLAYAEAGRAPEVRKDRVEELKARIESGDYATDNRKIAEKLVQNEAFLAKTLIG